MTFFRLFRFFRKCGYSRTHAMRRAFVTAYTGKFS